MTDNTRRLTPEAQSTLDAARKKPGIEPLRVVPAAGPTEDEPDPPTIGGYYVESDNLKWGPFDDAQQATEWAEDTLTSDGNWAVRPLLNPDAEK